MRFKEPHMVTQFQELPATLQEMARFFELLAAGMGVMAMVTRVSDWVEGESGVHRDNRALDMRDEFCGPGNQLIRLFTDEQVAWIIRQIEARYPRHDGKPTIMHHAFGGGPRHFHLQVPRGSK